LLFGTILIVSIAEGRREKRFGLGDQICDKVHDFDELAMQRKEQRAQEKNPHGLKQSANLS
jgi:hypothetical protein